MKKRIVVVLGLWFALSAGLLSKVLSIKHSIQSAKKRYDLLKGAETYKNRLGGKPVLVYQCDICL